MSTKDFIEKDYYKVLGVPKDATEAEIKKAYRKLARENHPDANKGNAKAEERFKEISEANDVLGDPKKRKEYDEARALFGNGGFRPGPGGAGGGNVQLRPGRPLRRRRPGRRRSGRAAAASAAVSVTSSAACSTAAARARHAYPAPARPGHRVRGRRSASPRRSTGPRSRCGCPRQAPCKACAGTGDKNGTPRVCPTCVGTGQVSRGGGGGFSLTDPCVDCKGRGLIAQDPCEVCKGSGRAKSSRTMQVRIPAGRQRRPAHPAARQGRARVSAAVRPATCTSSSTSTPTRSSAARATTSR